MNRNTAMAAEVWFERLRSPTSTADEREAFSCWYADPAAARTYNEVLAVWEAAGAVGERPGMVALRREILQVTRTRSLCAGAAVHRGGRGW